MSYKLPIEVFQTQLRTEMDGEILKAVHEVGLLVDKAELLKALEYDRGQYIKGYDDCWNEYGDAIEKQIPKKVVAGARYKCPSCGEMFASDWKFCFECGQKLDWTVEE